MNDGNISETTIAIINTLLPVAKRRTILELGSGEGTQRLADLGFKMISIEHSEEWVGKYDSTYIHADLRWVKPTKQFPDSKIWYHPIILKHTVAKMKGKYDLILIDGPPRYVGKEKVGRGGLFKYREMFDWDVPVIFDDTHRELDWKLAYNIARRVCPDGRPLFTYDTHKRKMATLMLPKTYKEELDFVKDLMFYPFP